MSYRIFIAIGLLLFSTSIFAATQGIPATRTITLIQTYEDYAAVYISPTFSDSLSGCTSTVEGQAYVIDWSTNTGAKALYNAALAAFLLGKTVGFGISDATCHPYGSGSGANGSAIIYRVDMSK